MEFDRRQGGCCHEPAEAERPLGAEFLELGHELFAGVSSGVLTRMTSPGAEPVRGEPWRALAVRFDEACSGQGTQPPQGVPDVAHSCSRRQGELRTAPGLVHGATLRSPVDVITQS